MTHIKGKDVGKVMLYTLSTCIWCRKTKNLLKEIGIDFTYEDVDLLEGEDEEKATEEMDKYSTNPSFPIMLVDGKLFNMGFDEDKIRQRLDR